jgi:hypothetical protein
VLGAREGAGRYQGTDAQELRTLLEALPIEISKYAFVDYGSGKGRALLVAGEYPFRSVTGVEFAVNLHTIAERNIRIDRGPRRCQDVRSVLGDATAFSPPPGPVLVYLYNPFGKSGIERVLDNLQSSRKNGTDELLVLYYTEHPDCLPSMFTERGFVHVSPVGRFTLYRADGQR